jgi:hypothetical protein
MDNTVGYVLLASAAVPGLMGLVLSLRGLSETEAATKKVKAVTKATAVQLETANSASKALLADRSFVSAQEFAHVGTSTALNLVTVTSLRCG